MTHEEFVRAHNEGEVYVRLAHESLGRLPLSARLGVEFGSPLRVALYFVAGIVYIALAVMAIRLDHPLVLDLGTHVVFLVVFAWLLWTWRHWPSLVLPRALKDARFYKLAVGSGVLEIRKRGS